MENEIWKDILGYEGHYQVSNFGMVKSFIKWNGNSERFLKPSKNSHGYLMVILHKNRKPKNFAVHQLVAMAFLNHKPNGYKIVVDHIDNDKLNNRADNLQLITNRENCSKDRKGTSKFPGVSWNKSIKKWGAKIQFNGRFIHLGYFELEIEASNAYQKALEELEQGLDLNVLYLKRVKTSKYVGVHWNKSRNKWIARYKSNHIGYFDTELEAYESIQNYIENLKLNSKFE